MRALLVLEDGAVFKGESIGVKGEAIGPISFDTRVVGYQEAMTDPAHAGKILMFTYPLIGNYGVNDKFNESDKAWIEGLVIKEKSRIYSNWQAKGSFDGFLKQHNLMAISKVDTRTLTVYLRGKGSMWAAISCNGKNAKYLLSQIHNYKKNSRPHYIQDISVKKITVVKKPKGSLRKIGVLDLGVCKSLIRQLVNLDCQVVLLPFNTPASDILKLKLKGLIVSSGPEEDEALNNITDNISDLIGKIPVLGISSGHQIIAQALGAKIIRMKIGHHGVNYPIIFPGSNKGEITVQNHNLVVDRGSLKKTKALKVCAINLNDQTVEEIESPKLKIMGLQYYPASPGFEQINPKLAQFMTLCR